MRAAAVRWAMATVAAVALAIPGVILYAREPGVLTYQLNGLLLLPLVALTLYGVHRLLPLRVQWAAAWLIAPLGGMAYLVWPNEQWWNYGMLTALPLVALAFEREERLRRDRRLDDNPTSGGWADGPWGPP